ncbi:Fic family protein [Streptomyces sp. IMTB 1903]|uniref:Fic family protein n=1 Tax=Streptomyces sp. IMTB 1903 TaxID=1776680 RepID=UPI000AA39FF6|nr:Fic family protein [Streptomyces sp. IMTB 1903]
MASRGRPTRASIYQGMEEGIRDLRQRFGGLPTPTEAEDIWAHLWHEEAHNSTALEGNTLVLHEVEKLLEEGKAVGAKPLRDYLEVKGYGDAATWVYGQALKPGDWTDGSIINMQEVRQVHHTLMTPVWTYEPAPGSSDQEGPGKFRRHEIQEFSGGMKPPSWTEVDHLMRDWVDSAEALREPDGEVPLPERLAIVHNRFEQIHPFLDGNGRTGRLTLNLLLGRLGYPPAIIHKRDREKYLRGMQRADKGEPGPLAELIARSVTNNLHRFVLPAVAGPVKLLPLAALETEETKERALRAAAARGRLKAVKEADGTWRSSKAWVEQYEQTKHQKKRT